MLRTERHIITKSHELFKSIDEFSFKCKNLYNYANYIVRQEFITNGKWIRFKELWNMIKNEEVFRYAEYSHTGQQILRLLDKNWLSFFKAIKDYNKHPEKYKGKPKLPGYKHKYSGRSNIIFATPPKEKNNKIKLPKLFNSFELTTKLVGNIHQLRIVPKNGYYVIEVIKEVEWNKQKPDNGRYIGIDIGVDNLTTVVNNIGLKPFIANGKGLKSINQYWNKEISKVQSELKICNNKETSNKLDRMWLRRSNQINDYLHKTSRFIINYCLDNDINTIVIGHNKQWKDSCNLGKVNNQNFVQIPVNNLIHQLQYKGEEEGINVIITEESYTSKASFLDLDELPKKYDKDKEYQFSGKRIKRGLYKSKSGQLINADVNGAYNIIRKVFSNDIFSGYSTQNKSNEIMGVVVHPVKFNMN